MNAKTIITSKSFSAEFAEALARAETFTRWLDDEALPHLHAEIASHDGDAGAMEGELEIEFDLEFFGFPITARVFAITHEVSFDANQVCDALGVRDAQTAIELAVEFGGESSWNYGDGVDFVAESAARALAWIAAQQACGAGKDTPFFTARAEAFTRWLDDEALPHLHATAASYDDGDGGDIELKFCGLPIKAWIDADTHDLSFVASQVCFALGVRDVQTAIALAGEVGEVTTMYTSPDSADAEAFREWNEAFSAGDYGDGTDLVDESAARALALIAARQDQAVAVAVELGGQH